MRTAMMSLVLLVSVVVSGCDSSGIGEPSTKSAIPGKAVYPASTDTSGTPDVVPPSSGNSYGLTPTITATPIAPYSVSAFPTPTQTKVGGSMATVSVLNLNVREGPGTGHIILGQIHAGETFPIIGMTSSGQWLEIVYGNTSGWIFAEYVEVDGSLEEVPVTGVDPTATPIALPPVPPTDTPIAPPAVTPIGPPPVFPSPTPAVTMDTPIAPPAVTASPTPTPTPTGTPPVPPPPDT